MDNSAAAKFIEAMFKTSRLFRESMHYPSNIANLSILQIQTLNYLKYKNNAQMSEIAEHFHIELPSATSLLNKLVTLQLVKRVQDDKDRRLVRVVVTEEGNAVLTLVMKEKESRIKQLLSYLSVDEQRELLRLIEKLNNRMEDTNEH